MKYVRYMLAIFLMTLVVSLIVTNHDTMSTKVTFEANLVFHRFTSSEISIYYVVTITFLFGVIITGVYGMIERFRLTKALKLLKATSQEKDRELNSLRNLPITSDDISTSDDIGQDETNDVNGTLKGDL